MKFLRKIVSDPEETVEEVRKQILYRILIVANIIGIPLVSIAAIEAFSIQQPWLAAFYIALFFPVTLSLVFINKLTYKISAITILASIYLIGVNNLIFYGFSGAGEVLFLSMMVLAALFFSYRAAIISIFICLVPMAIVGYLFITETLVLKMDIDGQTKMVVSWLTALAILGMMGYLIVYGFGMIQKKLVNSLLYSTNKSQKIDKLNLLLEEDIKLRKDTENELKVALAKAQESDRLKSAFLATMSHEFRTPLNAVIGLSDIIDEETPKEEVIELCKTINANGNQLLGIVESIFDVLLMEMGEIQINSCNVQIPHLVREIKHAIEREREIYYKADLRFIVTTPLPEEKLTIITDPQKLKHIIINLLRNAFKFTNEGEVELGYKIHFRNNEKRLLFYVRDTGIGIPKEKQKIIFDLFRQGEESAKRLFGGTGVGLSIAAKLTQLLEGEISVESEPGKGSTFSFCIPVVPAPEEESPGESHFRGIVL